MQVFARVAHRQAPSRRRLSSARAVAARHRHRAARARASRSPTAPRRVVRLRGVGSSVARAAVPARPRSRRRPRPARRGCGRDERVECGSAAAMPPARGAKPRGADARVDPHDPVGEPREPLHLAADELGLAALPAVGQDHDHRAARHPAAAVAVVERASARRRCACRSTSRARPRRRAGSRARGCASASARVIRVSRVANTNASAFGPAPAAQVRNCRYARA